MNHKKMGMGEKGKINAAVFYIHITVEEVRFNNFCDGSASNLWTLLSYHCCQDKSVPSVCRKEINMHTENTE